MQQFFVMPSQVETEQITMTGSDVRHLRQVLRMQVGEQLQISDGNNHTYLCQIESYQQSPERAVLKILKQQEINRELPAKLYLFQALPKADKMDTIVQKAVELGVYEVIPMRTNRCVAKYSAEREAKRLARWQEIAKNAAMQAGRGIIPKVAPVQSYAQALSQGQTLDLCLFAYELSGKQRETGALLRSVRAGQSVGLLIGPEGGFEKEEAEQALQSGAREISLGKRILRTETAGPALLSALMLQLEEAGET